MTFSCTELNFLPIYLPAWLQVDAADIFVLRDDEDLEDVLLRVADQRQFGCVLVNNTRMDEPAQVRRGGRDARQVTGEERRDRTLMADLSDQGRAGKHWAWRLMIRLMNEGCGTSGESVDIQYELEHPLGRRARMDRMGLSSFWRH